MFSSVQALLITLAHLYNSFVSEDIEYEFYLVEHSNDHNSVG